jgi:hypothetical protein
MRKVCAGVAVAAACFALLIFTFEYNRVQNLCRSAGSRVESVHDAINAMRNSETVGHMLSAVRQTDAFQRDGYELVYKNDAGHRYYGGWRVKGWTTPLNRGYTVTFEYLSPEIEMTCEVYDCGGIDIPNCLTMGRINFSVPAEGTWVSPTTG